MLLRALLLLLLPLRLALLLALLQLLLALLLLLLALLLALLALLVASPPLSYEEIGARLGMPVGSIGPTRGRCLKKLRDLMEAR